MDKDSIGGGSQAGCATGQRVGSVGPADDEDYGDGISGRAISHS